ncbi:MAG: NAD-glutamate dehydrogenase [Asticcacaulis sp.]
MDGSGNRTRVLDVLSKAFATGLGRPSVTELDRMEHEFLVHALEDYSPNEIPEFSPENFGLTLAEFWRSGEVRQSANIALKRIRRAETQDGNELPYELIELIQDDAPFLVDTVMGELADQGVSVRAMFHPLVTLERNSEGRRKLPTGTHRESMILIVVDCMTNERRKALNEGLDIALADLRVSVLDFDRMLKLMQSEIDGLKKGVPGVDPAVLEENIAFLQWLHGDHFVFLGARGYTYPRAEDGSYAAEAPLNLHQEGLGVLRDPNRPVLRSANEPAVLTAQMRRQLDLSEPVTVAKANLRSRVHRRTYMDYVGIKRYGPDGKPAGEVRFVGLFTAEAYDQASRDVPLIRRKVDNVMARAGKTPDSHNEKRLRHIVEGYPRDELFQMSEDDLLNISQGILHLIDRPQVRLFTRRDPFDRFYSVLLYIPRDLYDSSVRKKAADYLADAYGGRISAWYPQLDDSPLVRIHYIIGVTPGNHNEPDEDVLEAEIAEMARAWTERFEVAARESGLLATLPIAGHWAERLPLAYRERYSVEEALLDLETIASADPEHGMTVRAFRAENDSNLRFRFKLYHKGDEAVPLADVLPILDNMGLKAMEEYGHPAEAREGEETWWIHEFVIEDPQGANLKFSDVKGPFETAFVAIWKGWTENDGFNRMALLGLSWREVAVFRALCRYRQQSGMDPSQAIQEAALIEHADVTRKLLDLFQLRFDPAHADGATRSERSEAISAEIEALLQTVASLDYDRVLRRLAALINAIQRTNFYQTDAKGAVKSYISFKIHSRELIDLPQPKPLREIFVWSPRVEGVHLRFGPVARGGLRWSDRRDDFRTEVLGLVKAQQVKNAVIVPVGSKGGFYPKHLPRGGTPDAVRAEAIEAYKIFLSGLLDLTDNIDASNALIPPQNVVRWDKDDPYLVVAADKGTATFSDIANSVSAAYGFWLGDAFASGGSIGYDHKAMGITAKGAWEAVKRHFREMGKDIQSETFTAVGVGDMSGDVFGNGMLLSKQTKLVAAFDHRDIFIDPNPDPAVSWEERNRMFALPRSSWQDYDKSKISEGGGIFPRSAKSIALTPQIKALLQVNEDALSPFDLMRAILKAPAELLYFGGIGTYVKAPFESHLDVGDKANDAIRVDGNELRAKVIGEGANLGMTQAGRIAFARAGGRINTDAIDNSAGVDCSDHEVNIKILVGMLLGNGKVSADNRTALLASMTDDVSRHVLVHNYDQTLALTLQEATAAQDIDAANRFMTRLESAGKLDRKVEGLPTPHGIQELAAQGKGLTRPELAVLTAYSKNVLFEDVVASTAPDDAFFEATLKRYFPDALGGFTSEMASHRLRREIIGTVLTNELVNMAGPTFPDRLRASVECDTGTLVRCFEAARQILRLDTAWKKVSELDNRIAAEAQTALYQELSLVLRRLCYWLGRKVGKTEVSVTQLIEQYRPSIDALRQEGLDLFGGFEESRIAERIQGFVVAGAPEDLALQIGLLRGYISSLDIADLAREFSWTAAPAARVYHQVGNALEFDRMRAAVGSLYSQDHWERLAMRRLQEDLMSEQRTVAAAVLASAKEAAGATEDTALRAVEGWSASRQAKIAEVKRTITEIEQSGPGWSFAKLTIANSALRELAQSV